MSTLLGFVLGTVIGSLAGLLFWFSRRTALVAEPWLVVLNALPKLALAPVLVILFGIGFSGKVVLAFLMTVVTVAISAWSGVKAVDPALTTLMYSLGARKLQVFLHLVVPSAMPWMISGLRVNIALSMAGAIVGEFIASDKGLGRMIVYAGTTFDLKLVWVGVVVLSVLSVLMYLGGSGAGEAPQPPLVRRAGRIRPALIPHRPTRRMMPMKRILALLTAALLLLPMPGLAEAAPRKLTVAEPVHLIGYLPLYAAIHEGYFAEEGLEVQVVQATDGAHVTAVVSGDAFAVIGSVDSNCLANRGSRDPVIVICNCVNRANVYLFARKGLAPVSSSAEDMAAFLRGKTIVAGRYGGSPNVLTRYLLRQVGLDPDRDVTLVENADASTVTAMLQHGQGDIGNGGEPQIMEGVTAGIWEEPFVKFPDLGDYAYSVIGVKQSTIEDDPDACLRFVRGLMRALAAVQEDHAMAARVLEKEFSTLTEEARQAALNRAYEDQLWSPDGVISQAAVDTLMEVIIASGLYDGTYTYDGLVDMRFVHQVNEALGE